MAVTYVELQASQDHSIDQYGRFRAVREFSSPFADLVVNRELIRALTFAVNTVTLRPRRVYVTSRDPQCPGNSIIRAEYSSPEDVTRYQVGKAYLSIRSYLRSRKMIMDYTAGTKLGVNTTPDTDGTYWRPITNDGDLATEDSLLATVRLTTAYTTTAIDFAAMNALIGKCNAAAFTINSKTFADVATLKLMSVDLPRWFLYDADSLVIPIIYTFVYRPTFWHGVGGGVVANQLTTAAGFVGKRKKSWIRGYILHEDDDPTQATRHYMKPDGSDAGDDKTKAKWRIIPVERKVNAGADTGVRKIGATGDFSTLFAMLAWTP